MTYLLDTNVWLGIVLNDRRIDRARLEARLDGSNARLSMVVPWEIALKCSIGKLALPAPPATFVPAQIAAQGIEVEPIALEHALHVATLPPYHKDPFDRLLVAQAQLLDATIVTTDRQIAAYDVAVLDPRA